ncbi:hypothetical protein ACGFKX_27605 [Pseudonocardia alni]|uniref:hypothetical protein n=1 Tax=Pseudonocardia alni TaxID=33907 RepID=UPI00371BB7BA
MRHRFFVREHVGEPDPPLARVLRGGRGGRGGDVRFRLYLSLLWLVRDEPELSFPARSWAALLGLDEPETKGARRIKDALRWLEDIDLVRLKRAAGHDSVVQVRDDAGTGEPYELPGSAYNRLRNDPAAARAHLYTRIPNGLWTGGWMSILSGPAVAMLLVLLYETARSNSATVWFSPSLADLRYGLSEDTRGKGLLQLEQAGLVDVRRRAIAPDGFDYRKVRNVHTLQLDTLTTGRAELRAGQTRAQLRKPTVAEFMGEPFASPDPAPRRLKKAGPPGTGSSA